MTRPRRDPDGLTMPAGRRIPRPPDERPARPPVPSSGDPDPVLAKAGAELSGLVPVIRACTACTRAGEQRAFGSGYARAGVFLVKDRPSEEDLRSGATFAEEAQALEKAFERLAIPMSWVYGSTAVRCRTSPVTTDEARACSDHLLTEIEAVSPRVLVAFGQAAFEAVQTLDGRCALSVPAEVNGPVRLRAGLDLVVTEPLPEGINDREAKRRLWRDLQLIPGLLRT